MIYTKIYTPVYSKQLASLLTSINMPDIVTYDEEYLFTMLLLNEGQTIGFFTLDFRFIVPKLQHFYINPKDRKMSIIFLLVNSLKTTLFNLEYSKFMISIQKKDFRLCLLIKKYFNIIYCKDLLWFSSKSNKRIFSWFLIGV